MFRISGVELCELQADLELISHITVLSHHTSLHPRPYRHITTPINTNIHMNIAISLHPILCSQPQSWSHSESHFVTRNPLSVFNRIGPYSETSSDLDTLPLSSTSFFGSRYTAVFSTLDLALIFATPYYRPRYAIPRYSVLGPRYARTANSGKTTSPNRVKVWPCLSW